MAPLTAGGFGGAEIQPPADVFAGILLAGASDHVWGGCFGDGPAAGSDSVAALATGVSGSDEIESAPGVSADILLSGTADNVRDDCPDDFPAVGIDGVAPLPAGVFGSGGVQTPPAALAGILLAGASDNVWGDCSGGGPESGTAGVRTSSVPAGSDSREGSVCGATAAMTGALLIEIGSAAGWLTLLGAVWLPSGVFAAPFGTVVSRAPDETAEGGENFRYDAVAASASRVATRCGSPTTGVQTVGAPGFVSSTGCPACAGDGGAISSFAVSVETGAGGNAGVADKVATATAVATEPASAAAGVDGAAVFPSDADRFAERPFCSSTWTVGCVHDGAELIQNKVRWPSSLPDGCVASPSALWTSPSSSSGNCAAENVFTAAVAVLLDGTFPEETLARDAVENGTCSGYDVAAGGAKECTSGRMQIARQTAAARFQCVSGARRGKDLPPGATAASDCRTLPCLHYFSSAGILAF